MLLEVTNRIYSINETVEDLLWASAVPFYDVIQSSLLFKKCGILLVLKSYGNFKSNRKISKTLKKTKNSKRKLHNIHFLNHQKQTDFLQLSISTVQF